MSSVDWGTTEAEAATQAERGFDDDHDDDDDEDHDDNEEATAEMVLEEHPLELPVDGPMAATVPGPMDRSKSRRRWGWNADGTKRYHRGGQRKRMRRIGVYSTHGPHLLEPPKPQNKSNTPKIGQK
eukprot:5144904-Amphidinium_carterae.1